MTVNVYQNLLGKDQIAELINYFRLDDEYVDDRFDVRSKSPKWNDSWPNDAIKKQLKKILLPYKVETVIFNESKISFRIHVDSDTGHNKLYKNVLIPLQFDGEASTVFFKNYWLKKSTRFSRTNISPFRYNMFDNKGEMIWVDDIRVLLEQCKNNPTSVNNFTVSNQFISSLEDLIVKRNHADDRTSDYSEVLYYDKSIEFDSDTHKKYLHHIPIEDLHGLTIDSIYSWNVGDIVIFDRTQLHCAGAGHKIKLGLSLFLDVE